MPTKWGKGQKERMRIFVSDKRKFVSAYISTYWGDGRRDKMRIFVSALHTRTNKLGRRAEGEDENICEGLHTDIL